MRYDRHKLARQKTESFSSGSLARLSAEFREQLILEHLQEVKLIARRIHEVSPVSVALDDLVSAGIVGLISALDSYDANRKGRFQTYAKHRIRVAILDSLRGMTMGSYQRHKRARLIEAAISMLEFDEGRMATESEIASQLRLSVPEYQGWLSDLHGLTLGTLENVGPKSDPSQLLVYQTNADPHSLSRVVQRFELEGLLSDAIGEMPAPERIVLKQYYYEELTLSEIAEGLHQTELRVGQLKSQAIIRLRSHLSRRHSRTVQKETHDRPSYPRLMQSKEKDTPTASSASEEKSSVPPGFEKSDAGQHVSSLIHDPTVGILMTTAAAFQNFETGRSWLFTPSPSLGNVTPVSLISTAAGREIVANELGLIEHGMF